VGIPNAMLHDALALQLQEEIQLAFSNYVVDRAAKNPHKVIDPMEDFKREVMNAFEAYNDVRRALGQPDVPVPQWGDIELG
jgi:hypothetical protein